MLNRQKALVQLVEFAGGEIDRLVLTKWAFLTRQETESRGGDAFYDFVPYHFGPFSFSLYQEVEKLVSFGYLQEKGKSGWALGTVAAPAPEVHLLDDLALMSSRFGRWRTEELLEYVYEKYPHFTVNSKTRRLADRPIAPLAVYTSGYQRKSVDAFLNALIETGVRHLIDVRKNPIARRYGFHRSTLARLCGLLGIEYSHVPSLGVASEFRKQLNTPDDYDALLCRYEATTLKSERMTIERVAGWTKQSPSVLVCMEADPCFCHRSRLAESVSRAACLPIVNLM